MIYIVTIDGELENGTWYPDITNVSLGSQTLVDGFVAAKGLFSQAKLIVPAPPNNGENELYGSWSLGETAAVNTAIVANSTVSTALVANVFWTAFNKLTHNYPVVVFVFDNGDTAQYVVNNPGQVGLCCAYIPGSAKDKDGNPLDAPDVNPADLRISSGGGQNPGVWQNGYSTPNSAYICSFDVDGDGNVVDFIGCVAIP